jgi:hypothetical protein
VDFSARRLRASEAAWRARKRCTSAWCADSVRFVLSTSADVLSALRNADHAQATHKKTRASPRAAPRYDLVHSAMTLEHLVSPLQTALVQQLCELLAPSGRGWLHLGGDSADANQQRQRSCDVRGAAAASELQRHQTGWRMLAHAVKAHGCKVLVDEVGRVTGITHGYSMGGDVAGVILHLAKDKPAPHPRGMGGNATTRRTGTAAGRAH